MINLKVLFLQYDTDKYPNSLFYFQKYLDLLTIPYELIVIDNKTNFCDEFTSWSGQVYIPGNNSLHEFSGWDVGVKYLKDDYDVILFACDAWLAPGGITNIDEIINDNAVRDCYNNNDMIGNLVGNKDTGYMIKGIDVSQYARSHVFMLSKPILKRIKTLVTVDFDFLDQCIAKEPTFPYFLPNTPLSKILRTHIIEWLQVYWHSKINILENWGVFRYKTLMYLNELLLTAKITGKM